MVETFSEGQSDRTVLVLRDVQGGVATVIVLRRAGRVHVVFHGALRTTVMMTDAQATEMIDAVAAASRGPR
ncbi:MAG: hypothetical protein ACRDRM_05635 [Pseudonocardiaceae bacterium]